MRVAIAEDDPGCAKQLRDYLSHYGADSGEEINVSVFPDGMELVESYRPVFDLLLLDIEMPHMDGMSAAQRIRATDPAVLIIFITNMAQFAIKGYEVDALDYVLKPISYYAFAMKMRKAVRALRERTQRSILVRWGNEVRRLSMDSIQYVEVADHQLRYHTEEESYISIGSLREAEQALDPEFFCRCNSCYLVNLKFVDGIRQDCVMVAGQELKISRAKKKAFMQRLSDYYSRGGR